VELEPLLATRENTGTAKEIGAAVGKGRAGSLAKSARSVGILKVPGLYLKKS
jgi:hypothetical protein